MPAGTYTLTGDGMAVGSPTVLYQVIWRRQAGEPGFPWPETGVLVQDALPMCGGDAGIVPPRPDAGPALDTVFLTFRHTFPIDGAGQYQATVRGPAIPAKDGDQLVLRIALDPCSPGASRYIPYGEQMSSPSARWVQLAIP